MAITTTTATTATAMAMAIQAKAKLAMLAATMFHNIRAKPLACHQATINGLQVVVVAIAATAQSICVLDWSWRSQQDSTIGINI